MPRSATRGGLLAPQLNSRGYRQFALCRYGKVAVMLAGRIVLVTFCWPPPWPGARARHGEGGPADDSLANLSWG